MNCNESCAFDTLMIDRIDLDTYLILLPRLFYGDPMKPKYELISFALCPYVQRAVVTLKMKKADFTTTYIDLANRPSWFTEISPLGKVPLLKVDDSHVIFESAVISELLDETIEPRFHPTDPIARAKERAWMEFASSMIIDSYMLVREKNLDSALSMKTKYYEKLSRLEKVLSAGPYFRGADFSLVDATMAPTFMRMSLQPEIFDEVSIKDLPKVKAWSEALLKLDEVQQSVLTTFKEDFLKNVSTLQGALSVKQ